MLSAAIVALAGLTLGTQPSKTNNDEAQLPPRTANNSTSIDTSFLQPRETEEVNGRLWVGRPIIGGLDNPVRDKRQDGAASYGAYGEGESTIVVNVDGLFHFESARQAEIRPFESVTDRRDVGNPYSNAFSSARKKLAARIESARQDWLKDNNYAGGVRTFVNDTTLLKPARTSDAAPAPRAVIELSPDMPRFRSRQRVQGTPPVVAPHRAGVLASVTKVVVPAAKPQSPSQPEQTSAPDNPAELKGQVTALRTP